MGIKVNGVKKLSELTAATTINDNDVFMIETGNGSRKVTGATLKALISASADSAASGVQNIIAEEFDANNSYAIGDYVTYDGKLYKFTAAHATGAFDGSDAVEVTVTDEMVNDVTIDGNSIVSDGVAEIPIASSNIFGVTAIGDGLQKSSKNKIMVSKASSPQIKNGLSAYYPVVPQLQHESTFYGLAKAAGDTTQSASNNTVGTYTDEAKVAIQKMLGIYEAPWELIEDFTLTEEGRFDKTTEPDGTLYNFRGVYIRVFYAANLQTASTGYGRYMCEDSDGTYINAETGKYNVQTNPCAKFVYIMRNGTMAVAVYSNAATTGNAMSWKHKDINGIKFDFKNIQRIYMNAADVEPAGTRIQIYAQRAY